jgi:hypothetical protein
MFTVRSGGASWQATRCFCPKWNVSPVILGSFHDPREVLLDLSSPDLMRVIGYFLVVLVKAVEKPKTMLRWDGGRWLRTARHREGAKPSSLCLEGL